MKEKSVWRFIQKKKLNFESVRTVFLILFHTVWWPNVCIYLLNNKNSIKTKMCNVQRFLVLLLFFVIPSHQIIFQSVVCVAFWVKEKLICLMMMCVAKCFFLLLIPIHIKINRFRFEFPLINFIISV